MYHTHSLSLSSPIFFLFFFFFFFFFLFSLFSRCTPGPMVV